MLDSLHPSPIPQIPNSPKMNPNKIERDLFHHSHNHRDHDDDVIPQSSSHHHLLQRQTSSSSPPIFPDIVLFRASPPSSPSDTSSSSPNPAAASAGPKLGNPSNLFPYINPEPHISTQFYTFNEESHSLMIHCLLSNRLATPVEIRSATPPAVLQSWRAVWKDRNEDTAYLTAWKRIQEKLSVHAKPDNPGNNFLCFKNNSQQFVSHFSQWQDIVVSFHGDADSKHLGLKDTIDKIKQVWTVGAKFYGIPESFIRVCIAACPICNGSGSGAGGNCEGGLRSKRRRFEYTESFDVPAKEVPSRLQQLAKKHKVVLCIRQKYIRYKPFMAEVKDYACHRAGEPVSKRSSRVLKREPYVSKRCGCGFRIRAIVPISNYNEKDKSFVYQEEGMAVFKLYAVHSGHEPGPLDGNARIMHRVVGHKNGLLMDADDEPEQDQDQDQDVMYGVNEEMESDAFGLMGKDDGDLQLSVLQQVQELRAELSLLERRVGKIPREMLPSVSQELFDINSRVRRVREDGGKSIGLLLEKPPSHPDDVMVCEADLAHWSDHHPEQLYAGGKDTELIDDDEDSFGRTLGDVVSWEQMREDCRAEKDLMEPCKPDKWLKCSNFDAKSILDCEDTKLTKPLRHDDNIVGDESLVGIQVESFYQENPKWFDSPCALDSGTDCGDSGFRHGEIV